MVAIELKVYMHCKACETSVSKTLRKCKGITTPLIASFLYCRKFISMYMSLITKNIVFKRKTIEFSLGVKEVKVQMEEHKVTVIGQFDPAKVLKKLKKKTGKIAKIMEEVDGEQIRDENNLIHDNSTKHSVDLEDGDGIVIDNCNGYSLINVYMFSDENPNACSIM